MLEHIQRLVAHLYWADLRALAALRDSADPPAFGVERLAHILGAEEVWLARLEGREPEAAVWPALDLDGCEQLARRVHDRLERFVTALRDDDLGRSVSYRNSAGVAFESRIDDILLHVALHGAYHRGQVAAAVRATGQPPNYTDYIAFIRGRPPATRADAERAEGDTPAA